MYVCACIYICICIYIYIYTHIHVYMSLSQSLSLPIPQSFGLKYLICNYFPFLYSLLHVLQLGRHPSRLCRYPSRERRSVTCWTQGEGIVCFNLLCQLVAWLRVRRTRLFRRTCAAKSLSRLGTRSSLASPPCAAAKHSAPCYIYIYIYLHIHIHIHM